MQLCALKTINNSLKHRVCLLFHRLDYPGIGPEHSWLKDTKRAEYYAVTDAQALQAFQLLAQLEGIIPALESAHAFAYLDVRPLQHPHMLVL